VRAVLTIEVTEQTGDDALDGRVVRVSWPRYVDLLVMRHPPAVEDDDPVGQAYGLIDVMRHEHDRRLVGPPQPQHELVRLDPGERVEGAERLVQEQQLRLTDERAGQRDALTLPARERPRPRFGAIPQADLIQDGLHPLRSRCALGVAEAERDVGAYVPPREQARVLEDHRRVGRRTYRARIGSTVQPCEQAQHRGLARTGPAQDGDELALADGEVEPVQDHAGAEAAAYALKVDDDWLLVAHALAPAVARQRSA
jgi:hypothetical protein